MFFISQNSLVICLNTNSFFLVVQSIYKKVRFSILFVFLFFYLNLYNKKNRKYSFAMSKHFSPSPHEIRDSSRHSSNVEQSEFSRLIMDSNLLHPTNPSENVNKFRNLLLGENSLTSDYCKMTDKTKQSLYPGMYSIDKSFTSEGNIPNSMELYQEARTTPFQIAYSASPNLIELDSSMRQSRGVMTHDREQQSLSSLPMNHGSLVYGVMDRYKEQLVIEGSKTHERRTDRVQEPEKLSSHYFLPLIDHLEENVQNPTNIIQPWTRGGYPSRKWVHDQTSS